MKKGENMQKVILASESPRRREILSSIGLNYIAHSAFVDETFDQSLSIEKAVEQIALRKAEAVLPTYPNNVIIGADTIVVVDDEVLGKPSNDEEAYRMLKRLSGRTHRVLSGVAIISKDKQELFYEETKVTFYDLSEEMIHKYIATKECKDKAGAYGIQGKGCILVKEISGDYYNVVGLPIASLYRRLMNF